ncbi:protein SOB FIVE-LIKE 5-like [Mercurialis annua]|uniref:protein SOB FIVE-LIKE 5-like n=1 Tax=Mercurialis annua TaxID=3986 RepID=UPI00215E0326|nr:protein SOB FIVE-LIKE 5-like [Mercurialis annua]
MNFDSSECSSGCESGWTLYLEQSFLSPSAAANNARSRGHKKNNGKQIYQENNTQENQEQDQENIVEEEDEDLSMVSDASSGPPHFNEDESYFNYDNGHFYPAFKDSSASLLINHGGNIGNNNKRSSKTGKELPNSNSFLDDTASSPAFNLSKTSFGIANNNQASMESMLDYSQGFLLLIFRGDLHIKIILVMYSLLYLETNLITNGFKGIRA